MQPITPFLWFDDEAEEAAKFYTSVFPDSRVLQITRFTVPTPSNKRIGSVMTVAFELNGQKFVALNGGPFFKFNESVSFVVTCETQAELDRYWRKLSAGGSEVQCGWIKDRFGLSWQVVPAALDRWLSDPDTERVARVMRALLKMVKPNIRKLQAAYNGRDGRRMRRAGKSRNSKRKTL